MSACDIDGTVVRTRGTWDGSSLSRSPRHLAVGSRRATPIIDRKPAGIPEISRAHLRVTTQTQRMLWKMLCKKANGVWRMIRHGWKANGLGVALIGHYRGTFLTQYSVTHSLRCHSHPRSDHSTVTTLDAARPINHNWRSSFSSLPKATAVKCTCSSKKSIL